MSYTPINWQTGQTITAEKLNKMDNGWGFQNTQLFSETVTTVDSGGFISEFLEYSNPIDADSITVTFNGTDYTCPIIDAFDAHFYGGFSSEGPDFSVYPFAIRSSAGDNMIYTETAGTYTVSASNEQLNISDDFKNAVLKAADYMPFLCVQGVSTEEEMTEAYNNSRLLYFQFDGSTYVVIGVGYGSVDFMPTNASITARFVDGIFTIGEQ